MKRKLTCLLTAFLLLTGLTSWGQLRTEIVDVLNRELTGVTGSTYASWEGMTSNSDAVYAGQSAGGNESIQLRSNNNNSGIITTASGGIVTYISVTWNENTASGRTLNVYGKSSAYSSPTELYNEETQGTLIGTIVNGTSTELEISDEYEFIGMRSASGAMYLTEIDITWTTSGGTPQPTVATPTFSPAGGTYFEAQNVSISCATEGATIYYTLDDTTPDENSAVYSSPISIAETTTVKAIAMKEGYLNSGVASATYTIEEMPSILTIAEARALDINEYALVQGVVTFIDGRNVYVQDETAGIDLYLNNNTVPSTLALGDMVQAYGKRAAYNGLAELSGIDGNDAEQFSILSSGNTLPLAVKTIAEIVEGGADALQCTRVKIEGATIGAINTNGNTPLTQDETSINIYKVPALTGIEEGDLVDVIAVVGYYNAAQLRVAFAEDVVLSETPPQPQAQLTVVPAELSGFTYDVEEGGPSAVQYFEVSGTLLTSNISIFPSDNFEISSFPGEIFQAENPSIIHIPSSGNLYNIQIYVRLKAGLEVGTYNEQIPVVSEGAITKYVNVSGTVNGVTPPTFTVATPTFTPAAGTYYEVQNVNITCETEGATIYYSTVAENGPWTAYTEAITVDENMTIWAYAEKEGYNDSNIVEATYTIQLGLVTIFNQDWEGEMNGWTFVTVEGSKPWNVSQYQGNHYAYANGYNGGANEQWCISPAFNIHDYENVVLSFRTAKNYNGPDLELKYSTNYDGVDPTTANWWTFDFDMSPGSYTWTESGDIPISIYPYPVHDCYIAFKYTSTETEAAAWEVDDIILRGSTSVPNLTATPSSLSGFTHVVGEGPSESQYFTLSGVNIGPAPGGGSTGSVIIQSSENEFEVSLDNETFSWQVYIDGINGTLPPTPVYVRMNGAEVGQYTATVTIHASSSDEATVALSGTVTAQPVPGDDYVRISDVSQLVAGNRIVFAARFDENATDYYAMSNASSGKPSGVLFTSTFNGNDEILPASILNEEDNFYWTVGVTADGYTFTNAAGDMIGYTSSTNFASNGDNTEWDITVQTSEGGAMVPNYTGFVISNVNNPVRAFALNSSYNFGAYHTQNMGGESYNFFLDIFMQGEGGVPPTPTVATPTFTPAAGTYFEAQTVSITCTTDGATIYYSTVSENGPWTAYENAIPVNESMTIWAYAEKGGYNNSNIAEATYTIQLGVVTIFNQDWEGEMNGWTFVDVMGEASWNVASYGGNHYAYANGYNHGANEDWCISPAFNLNALSNPVLSFRTAKNFPGPNLVVSFSNNYDGEDPTEATWIPLTCTLSPGSWTWTESGDIDLSGFSGSNCYIGFKYTCEEDSAAGWEVDDILLIGQTSDPIVTISPLALTGFTYIEGNGPSTDQSFTVSGFNLSSNITITDAPDFEISRYSGDDFVAQNPIILEPVNGNVEETTIYVRLKAGLEVGNYNEEVIGITSEVDDYEVVCSGTVTAQPVPGDDYVRIHAVSELVAGNRVVFAARFDENATDYYAMSSTASGHPAGVLFTSAFNGNDEILPSSILAEEDNFYWTVNVTADGYTFTNANGDMIGYTSSTNFSPNGDNTEWDITVQTSEEGAMVPNYTGFVIANINNPLRAFALNNSHNFGPYHTQNIASENYNFFLDIFMQGEGGTCTVAAPTFDPAGGTYYEPQEVTISCATPGATIWYSLISGNGPWTPYTGAITVEEFASIWAYASMEGCNDSPVVNAGYLIQDDLVIIFNQDWEDDWNDWTEVCEVGDSLWHIGSYQGNHYAYANGYNHDPSTDWLISPAFDLDSYSNVVLTFRTAKYFDGPILRVFFSNEYDGQNINPDQWQELECELSQGSWNWVPAEISLEGYNGNNCHIAFWYNCNVEEGAAAWEVDDIMLTSGGSIAPTPTLTATPNTINNGFDYVEGQGPSLSRNYTLTGANLEGNGYIELSVNEYFEILQEDGTYDQTLQIPYENGQLEGYTVYVRMVEGLEVGYYEDTIIHQGGGAYTEVSVSGTVVSENEPYMMAFMPYYIQGNNGSNNNRVPVATAVYLYNLEPNTTYRYTNQFVDDNDGPETAGAGNVIYAYMGGFYRSTSPSLATEGNYGEFTTDEEGTGFVWFMNEPTANARFTPGNHVYLRIRLNDGHDGTTVEQTFTSGDYATVLNFGTEYNEYNGSAFYVKSNENPMSFAMLMPNGEDVRPLYSTSIETTGIDFGSINQYADFYKDLVAGQNGWFGGILPNDCESGVNVIFIMNIQGYLQNAFFVEDGQWNPDANTVNPTNGLDEPIFIDLTDLGVEEPIEANVKVWSADHEFVIENGDESHYTMTVYNVLGQAMMQQQINAGSTMRVSHNLAVGLYVISLQNNQNKVAVKVMVK